jgi:hypothetical protein
MRRFMPTLLLALPFVVALAPAAADSTRTIGIKLSRFMCPPDAREVNDGKKASLDAASAASPRNHDHTKTDCKSNGAPR